jgi:23S rRNA G2445 N2-methylase RlmL
MDESLSTGLLGALQLTGSPLRFRISPLRYGRWEIRDFLIQRYGWINDPGTWDINLEVCGSYLVAQVGKLYYTRRFRALEHIPASTNPIAATVMINLLKVLPGQTVYDPFCGGGTLLVEVLETVPRSRVVGSDVNKDALVAARHNLAPYPGRWKLRRADAQRIAAPDGSVERLVSNMPFGKRVGSHGKNQELYANFATELARVLSPDGLAVLLTEEKELLRHAIKATRSLRILREHMFTVGGLHPSAFVPVQFQR